MPLPPPPAYYRVPLDQPPKIVRIRSSHHENFRYDYIWNNSRCFEINYIQQGNMCEERTDGVCCYEQGTVHTLVANRVFTQYSTAPVLHEYYLVTSLPQALEPISEEQVANWVSNGNDAIIPEYITEPALCHLVGNRLKELYEHAGNGPAEQLMLRSCLYELLALLSDYSVTRARERCGDQKQTVSPRTRKACQFINQNLAEPFTVDQVAKAAGVTYSHLKNIFVRDMGMPMVEYRNLARIRMVEQMLTLEGVTLEEAGEAVGIYDAAYLSRMFRKYTGMSVREYRRLHKQ